ncbi:hypothetical protein GCM10027055_08060 [Janibacter alkaliphilus]
MPTPYAHTSPDEPVGPRGGWHTDRAMATTSRPRAWVRWSHRLTLLLLLGCLLAITPMYLAGGRTSLGVVVAAAVPAILLGALAAALVSIRHRTWLRLVLLLALLSTQWPLADYAVADPGADRASTPTSPQLRVAALNTLWGGPDLDELAALAADHDVLALQEMPPVLVEPLTERLGDGWQLAARDHDDYIDADAAVWVRDTWQVADAQPVPDASPAATALTLTRDDATVRLVGTRLQNPAFGAADRWGEGLDALAATASTSPDPVVILGDLNAPPSAVAFRRFLDDAGLADCPAQLGSGFPGTWGLGRGPDVAPVPIDHVLVGGPAGTRARCTAFAPRAVEGTDHRAVTATVTVPR